MIPTYVQVLEELKEHGSATSVEIAKEFHGSEKWNSLRASVLNKLKRAEKFRPDVYLLRKRRGRSYIYEFQIFNDEDES